MLKYCSGEYPGEKIEEHFSQLNSLVALKNLKKHLAPQEKVEMTPLYCSGESRIDVGLPSP